jgi:hypothetical protein
MSANSRIKIFVFMTSPRMKEREVDLSLLVFMNSKGCAKASIAQITGIKQLSRRSTGELSK